MWIVKLALRRPYTFVVAALAAAVIDAIHSLAYADGHFSRH